MLAQLNIADREAAVLLARPASHRLLAALIDQDCTMSMLVARSGKSYSLVTHHLRRLLAVGLVEIVGTIPRAGRATRVYRAAAQRYFVPAKWCDLLPGDLLMRELREALDRARAPLGVLLWSENGPRMRAILADQYPGAQELWLRMRLSPSAAREFSDELAALFRRWHERESASGPVYLALAACVRTSAD